MAFNKKEKIKGNIDSIRLLFELSISGRIATPQEKKILQGYCGFGGLKCILNPLDGTQWNKTDIDLLPHVSEVHQIIKENTNNENEYKEYINSLKSSVLTSFYTPDEIVAVLADILHDKGIIPNHLLDPSAGQGVFISAFGKNAPKAEVMAFEKDLLTGKLLSSLYSEHKIRIEGFERIEKSFTNYFDVVTSNIPFGDIAIFDSEYIQSQKYAYRSATKAIHNYFFLKGLDAVRDGGILAFITSQGVLDAKSNFAIRNEILKQANLVSAIRLPNNLFIDSANTEVGSDLIILQKDINKKGITREESLLLSTQVSMNTNIVVNAYFCQHPEQIICTKEIIGTDPYGKPAMIYNHEGGVKGIAADMRDILIKDLSQRLDLGLYNRDILHQVQQHDSHDAVQLQNSPTANIMLESKQMVLEKEPSQTEDAVSKEPIMSLYDLFNFSQEERELAQLGLKKNSSKSKRISPNQHNLFDKKNVAPSSPINNMEEKPKEREELKSRPFSSPLKFHHREGSLVMDNNQVGYLEQVTQYGGTFHPLNLDKQQKEKAELYIALRDSYQALYIYEAENHKENKEERIQLNKNYDTFIERFGPLNTKSNVQLLLMDASGRDTLSLERPENGIFIKADIFHYPVSFAHEDITHVDTPQEALSISLNHFGVIDLPYMESLCGNSEEELIKSLNGQIYFNPLEDNYEIKNRFIAGNITEKINQITQWLDRNTDNIKTAEVKESLAALKNALPRPIDFQELDFNFGERWIPTYIYEAYIKHLFNTDISITYSASIDEFTVHCSSTNIKITDQYAVKGYYRLYNGINLLEHALVNTIPDITKSIGKDENGNDIRVRDSEAIQHANAKIDEIRNGFTDWLNEQSPEFQQQLADMYNQKFNCFVRPIYDGSHQTFPGLDLKALKGRYGIEDVYQSQKDCIWMLLQNGGGICDHEVLRP